MEGQMGYSAVGRGEVTKGGLNGLSICSEMFLSRWVVAG